MDRWSLGTQIGAAAGVASACFLVGFGVYGASRAESQARESTLASASREAAALASEIDSSYATSREYARKSAAFFKASLPKAWELDAQKGGRGLSPRLPPGAPRAERGLVSACPSAL